MAQPTPYERAFSFTQYEQLHPSDPLPGDEVDAELNNVKATTDEIIENLGLIQRDDGAIGNGLVGFDQLNTQVLTGVGPAVPWTTNTVFALNASVFNGTALYRVTTAHTSGASFDPTKFLLLTDFSVVSVPDGSITTSKLADAGVTTVKIADGNVTPAKIAGLTASALLGRYSASTGVAQAITLGSGLAFSGSTLIAAGAFGHNILLNGDFRVNQRGYATSVALAAGSYGHDRWKAGASGGDYSFTQSPSDTTITIASGKSLLQIVEDKNVAGGSYILSWSGTSQGRTAKNGGSTSGSYAASPLTITGATAGQTITVEFNNGTLGDVQLEAGAVANVFERRPYPSELADCQRYCYVWKAAGAFSILGRADKELDGNWRSYLKFPVSLRSGVVSATAVGQFGIYNDRSGNNQLQGGAVQFLPTYGGGNNYNAEGIGILFSGSGLSETVGWMQAYSDATAKLIFENEL